MSRRRDDKPPRPARSGAHTRQLPDGRVVTREPGLAPEVREVPGHGEILLRDDVSGGRPILRP